MLDAVIRASVVVAALATLAVWNAAAPAPPVKRTVPPRSNGARPAREWLRFEAPAHSLPPAVRMERDAGRRGESGTPDERARLRRAFHDEWRTVMERLAYDITPCPPPELLQYPAEWDAPAPDPGAPHPPEAE